MNTALIELMGNATGHHADQILSWLDSDPDLLLKWLLLTALPTDFCFDGLRHVFERVEDCDSINLVCTIWYLRRHQNPGAALQFSARHLDSTVRYEYSVVPE